MTNAALTALAALTESAAVTSMIAADLSNRAPTPAQAGYLRDLYMKSNQRVEGYDLKLYRTEKVRAYTSLARRGLAIALDVTPKDEAFSLSDAGRAYIENNYPGLVKMRDNLYA